jgi:hypothetical protein
MSEGRQERFVAATGTIKPAAIITLTEQKAPPHER